VKTRLILGILASFPLVAFVATVLLACHSYAVTGHWPFYAHPDPKGLPNGVLLAICFWTFLAAVFSLVIYPLPALHIVVSAKLEHKRLAPGFLWPMAIFVLGVGLWVVERFIPGNDCLLEWLAD
jgi:hypothetical protein